MSAPAPSPAPSRGRRIALGLVALAVATAAWLPSVHLLFTPAAADLAPDPRTVSPWARRLAARHLRLWTDPALRAREIAQMRGTNAEWDFMGRSFLVWSLANLALRDPATKAECLDVIDRVIAETLRLEGERGIYFFLMDYARAGPFRLQPARSQFLDGEIALMLGVRRVVEEKPEYRPLLAERVAFMTGRMRQSPVLSAESYPDECWTFCNAVALAAIRVADHLDGSDHRDLFRDWVAAARARLVDPRTGILVSSYHLDGSHMDGPEGSSIWLAAHCLDLIDADFARDQYRRARAELGVVACGFGWAKEWPASWQGPRDVDSGPVVPVLEVSAGSSGLAFVGARAFRDADYFRALATTIGFAGFPAEDRGGLKYCASNQVGDAVLLYSLVLGPVWDRVKGDRR